MKELSIEEKAQAYDEALKWMENVYPTLSHEQQMEAEVFFPIFKESEDEKIRKELIDIVKKSPITFAFEDKGKVLAWLEKQGKQKPTNKIQPKFKIGDIIRFKGNETLKGEEETHKIVNYDNELYVFADGTTDLFCEQDLYELVEQKPTEWSEEDEEKFRDVIRLIEQGAPVQSMRDHYTNWLRILKDRVQPKPKQEWSEEDIMRIDNLIAIIENRGYPDYVSWLKSLKDKM